MPTSVSQYLKINQKQFDQIGAFDSVLDADARLFVDPFLLPHTTAPELRDGRDLLLAHFSKILTLLANTSSESDLTWKEADKLLRFNEVKGFNLGYGGEGSHGSGMGPGLRKKLLQAAREIVNKGIRDPVIFELVGLFQDDIGCDRIGDMACKILYERFLKYTSRVFSDLGITKFKMNRNNEILFIPPNPFRAKEPIILVPRDILRDLPIANDWSDISYICQTNNKLRQQLSSLVGTDWQEKTKKKQKAKVREFLVEHTDFFSGIIEEYKRTSPDKYDFQVDPSGEANWVRIAQEYANLAPLAISKPKKATLNELYRVINAICIKFRDLIEENGMWRFLYDEKNKPKHESASQLIFYAVSSIYCDANKLSISRECNAGRGPVDFKMGNGSASVVVEIKLSTNPYLIHAYEKQIPIYQKSEGSVDSIMVIILVKQKSKQLDKLLRAKAANEREKKRTPHIIQVDGLPKKSASKA